MTDGEALVAQVNRQKCEAFLSELNRQLGSTLALAEVAVCSLGETICPFNFAYSQLEVRIPRTLPFFLRLKMLGIGLP